MSTLKDDNILTVAAIRRLGRYLQQLRPLLQNNIEAISASQLSRELGIHETQIRRDFALLGLEGKPKIGHDVKEVTQVIENYLSVDNTSNAVLVGVGHLGTALLAYNSLNRFKNSGIKVIAAFDKNADIIGTTVHGMRVDDVSTLKAFIEKSAVSIGIITTTPNYAQDIADQMVEAGVSGIWNFAPTNIKLPPEIVLENAEIETGLTYISHMLKNRLKK